MENRARIKHIVKALEKHFGVPEWSGKEDPLDGLILTVLSQSTNDRNRDTAYRALRERFSTWEDVMESSTKEIAEAIRPAGLSNQKSVRIKDILKWIHTTYGSLNLDFLCTMDTEEVFDTFIKLKGVGVKTISVVLMFHCGVDIFPVDTHVHRLCRRIGLVPDNSTAEKTHYLMQPDVPNGKSYSLHMNFLKLGRTICQARTPKCDICPIKSHCNYGNQR
jgi:endonuclease-3